jgi:plasmid stability protein
MPQLIVRQLETAVVRRLRSRAAAEGVSVEEAHRRVLRQALLGQQSPARRNFVEYLQAMPDVDLPLARPRDLPRKVVL